jgi:hypothetical protein
MQKVFRKMFVVPGFVFAISLLVASLLSVAARATESDELPANFLAGMHVRHADKATIQHTKQGNIPTPHGFPAGVDTIVNFTNHFEAQGVYLDGSAHHIWEYSMVGNPPGQGGTTVFNAPVVPVTVDMRNFNGSPRFVKGQRLISKPDVFVQPFLNGPVYGTANYTSSPVATQITDAVQRAEFGGQATADWHTLLAPAVKTGRTMVLIRGTYRFALNADGTCCAFVLVDINTFENELFPPTTPDNSTVIGASEVAGDITTKDISTFFFPNTYLFFNGDPNQCCVLGFHSFDFESGTASNGNQPRFFVLNYSSWISPGLFGGGFQDVTAHSHEIAETFNDPFVGFDNIHNITPFWKNPAGQCQDLMEDGDVIEDLPNPVFPVTIGNFTYHPQTEALLPWFEFQSPSSAIDGAYSYPNEDVLTALSAPQKLNCQ